jgi:hypothetical protein
MKKLFSLLLAAVLMVSLCVVAFADDAKVTLDDVKGKVTTVVIGKSVGSVPAGALSVFPNREKLVTGASVKSVSQASGLKSGMSVETAGNPSVFEGFDVDVTEISDEDYDAWLAKAAGGKQGDGFIFNDGVIVLQSFAYLAKAPAYGAADSSSDDFVVRYSGSDEDGSWEEIDVWDKDPDKNPDAKLIKVEFNRKNNNGSEINSTLTSFKEHDGLFFPFPGNESYTFKTPTGETIKGEVTYEYNDNFTERAVSETATDSQGTHQRDYTEYWDSDSESWVKDAPSDQLA